MIDKPERPSADQLPPTTASPDGAIAQVKDTTRQRTNHALSRAETAPDDYEKVTVADFARLSLQELIVHSKTTAHYKDWPSCILFRCEIVGRQPTFLNYIFLSMAWEEYGFLSSALCYRLVAQYADPHDEKNNAAIEKLQHALKTPRVKFVGDIPYDKVTPEIMEECSTYALIMYAKTAARYGDTEQAIFFGQEIVRREPDDFGNRVNLAASFGRASRWIEAIEQREAAQKLNPHDFINNEKLRKLCEKIQSAVI